MKNSHTHISSRFVFWHMADIGKCTSIKSYQKRAALTLILQFFFPSQGYSVAYAGEGEDLGGGVTARWLRVYAPSKLFWCDLVSSRVQDY